MDRHMPPDFLKDGFMKAIVFPSNKWVRVIIGICWVLAMGPNAVAQLSDLRQPREPLPGIVDISQVGISVDMGSAPSLMKSAFIIKSLQSRLETFGYRVALAPAQSPDGLWLQVDCQA
ncbi:MAG: hypothetical protein VST67_00650, partial [Nitrospirota bacterium]|nr:hypothetical protein [Nitrospirota bacterium]